MKLLDTPDKATFTLPPAEPGLYCGIVLGRPFAVVVSAESGDSSDTDGVPIVLRPEGQEMHVKLEEGEFALVRESKYPVLTLYSARGEIGDSLDW